MLGVPKDVVMQDYLRSNDYIIPAYQEVIDKFAAAGGEPETPQAILGVKKEYLEAAFDEMETKYGTIENYFSDGLGIDVASQERLKDLYLVEVPTEAAGGWIKDRVSDCAVWSTDKPRPEEGVSWTGACIDGKASGQGVLVWWDEKGLLGRYTGELSAGKLNARVGSSCALTTRRALMSTWVASLTASPPARAS